MRPVPIGIRRFRAARALAAAVALTVARAEAVPEPPPVRVERHEEAMGSFFSLELYGAEATRLDAAAGAAFGEMHRIDGLLSNYRSDSEWSRMNRDAAVAPVEVSPELFALLEACLEYSRRSDGAFDITVGPLMKAWGFFKGEGRLPPAGAVADALARVGYRHVVLDRARRTVRFDRPGVELDPGGIGKGYAVDRMVEVLRRHGVRAAKVSAAGSSIYGMGAPPGDARGWRLTVRSPHQPAGAVADVFLKDAALSTSGSYEKFFLLGERRYAHVLDPRTGMPAQGAASVSVVASSATDSEAWTKPIFVNGAAWARRAMPKTLRALYCGDAPESRCEWLE